MLKKTTTDEFLMDCEPYFLDGVHVVALVAQRTQEIVRETVDRHWTSLIEALGFEEAQISRSDYAYPDRLQKAKPTDEIYIGVKLKISDLFEAAIYKSWEVEGKSTTVGIWTWIKGRSNLDRLSARIDELPDLPAGEQDNWNFEVIGNGTYFITRLLTKPALDEFNTALDDLITYYVRLISQVGGVKQFLN